MLEKLRKAMKNDLLPTYNQKIKVEGDRNELETAPLTGAMICKQQMKVTVIGLEQEEHPPPGASSLPRESKALSFIFFNDLFQFVLYSSKEHSGQLLPAPQPLGNARI